MSVVLSREVNAIQNAGLSAVLLWRFCVAYATARQVPASTPLPVLFVLLPLVFDEDSAALVKSTNRRSGLRTFGGKFVDSSNSKTDVLLSLERRAKELRLQTLEAFSLALRSKLLFLETATAEVVALSEAVPLSLPESVRPLIRNSEKLGTWSGGVSLFELSSILHVSF